MKKHILSSAALALVMTTGAWAQSEQTEQVDQTQQMAASGDYITTAGEQEQLASDLLGKSVYGSTAEDAERIGEINDMLLTQEGQIEGVVVGVGGFLGIGEKKVGIPFGQLEMATGQDGELRLVLPASKEQLEAAPTFEERPQQTAEGETTGAAEETQSADVTVVPADEAQQAEVTTETTTSQQASTEQSMESSDSQMQASSDSSSTESTEQMQTAATTETDEQVEEEAEQAFEQGEQQVEEQQTAQAGASTTTTGETTATNTNPDAMTFERVIIEREGYSEISTDELSTADLEGVTVYDAEDTEIGQIGELTDDDRAVLDVGSYLGTEQRPLAFRSQDFTVLRDEAGDTRAYLGASREDLETIPVYDPQ